MPQLEVLISLLTKTQDASPHVGSAFLHGTRLLAPESIIGHHSTFPSEQKTK
jgi:hypothetical protein